MPKYEQDSFIKEDEDFTPHKSLRQDILDLREELTAAIGELREAGKDWATKDNEMRKAKAKAFLQTTGKNKEEREAKADAGYEKERLAANIAEGEKVACKEHVQSLRTTMSALQALLYAERAENESIKYNQTQ
jgi:cell fate (sporulation/competence/biofilm development) regulator YlbF (YheA/YmcA/DUF963 family)